MGDGQQDQVQAEDCHQHEAEDGQRHQRGKHHQAGDYGDEELDGLNQSVDGGLADWTPQCLPYTGRPVAVVLVAQRDRLPVLG